jgi:hypothetical protein
MKRFSPALILLLFSFHPLLASSGAVAKPVPVFKAVDNAVIDGILDAGVKTAPLIIGAPNKDGLPYGKIYLAYDAGDIYIYADIKDAAPGLNKYKGEDITNGDSLEFTISTDPGANDSRESTGAYDFHFAIKASEDTETWSFTKKAPLLNPILFYKKKVSGYIIEALIPWYNFNTGCFCRIKNKAISFDAAINGFNAGGTFTQSRYCGDKNFGADPSQWGHVIFSTRLR